MLEGLPDACSTYTGSVNDCKIAFTVVAQQCRKIAPAVKVPISIAAALNTQMFLTPNVASQGVSVYQQLMPDDASLVYAAKALPRADGSGTFAASTSTPSRSAPPPSSTRTRAGTTSVRLLPIWSSLTAQACPRTRRSNVRRASAVHADLADAVGETGLAFAASIDQSLSWVKQIAAGKSQLKALTSMTWFNASRPLARASYACSSRRSKTSYWSRPGTTRSTARPRPPSASDRQLSSPAPAFRQVDRRAPPASSMDCARSCLTGDLLYMPACLIRAVGRDRFSPRLVLPTTLV